MCLMYVYGCVHTEVPVRHHDRGWVPTPNMHWCLVRDALAHTVWLRGHDAPSLKQASDSSGSRNGGTRPHHETNCI